MELPTNWGDLRVEQDLFGWKLYGGRKEFIECKLEEEARYLYIFLDLGMTEVNVPKDDAYLKKILPKLEKLKKRIDEIVNSYLRTVLNRKIHNEFCGLISP